jgi:hypothetical protein
MTAGDAAGAELLGLQAGSLGNAEALLWVAQQREKAGDINAAQQYARQAADAGLFSDPTYSPGEERWLSERVAQQWPYGLDPDGTPSAPW